MASGEEERLMGTCFFYVCVCFFLCDPLDVVCEDVHGQLGHYGRLWFGAQRRFMPTGEEKRLMGIFFFFFNRTPAVWCPMASYACRRRKKANGMYFFFFL
jgi:hypothetical protein